MSTPPQNKLTILHLQDEEVNGVVNQYQWLSSSFAKSCRLWNKRLKTSFLRPKMQISRQCLSFKFTRWWISIFTRCFCRISALMRQLQAISNPSLTAVSLTLVVTSLVTGEMSGSDPATTTNTADAVTHWNRLFLRSDVTSNWNTVNQALTVCFCVWEREHEAADYSDVWPWLTKSMWLILTLKQCSATTDTSYQQTTVPQC